MDLTTVILFLVLYYLRPQEWSGTFSTIHFVQIVMLTSLGTLFFRAQSLRLADLFRTPHDWAVFAFWAWMVAASPTPYDTFRECANLYIFYIVIVQTLQSVRRMKIFVGWWTFLIVSVALLALASEWGFDPLESLDITNSSMKGRLMLNLSIFNNPNGLGHSVVPAIPMLYFYMVWRRPVVWRVAGLALLAIPLYCIYLTVSKGAFLCAGITLTATMAFGRPKSVQVLIVAGALLFGVGALFALPRMNELNKSKSDEAIQGRVAAFKHGYELMQSLTKGVGKGNWGLENFMTDWVPVLVPPRVGPDRGKAHYILRPIHYNKAPHSSYVCTGAELGKPGLFLFVAVLYCCLRTTITTKTATDDEERIRRMLFVLVISYIVSSWMVDFEYRPTFFMFTAAIAALHRHLMGLATAPESPEEQPSVEPPIPVWLTPQVLPQPALAGLAHSNLLLADDPHPAPADDGLDTAAGPKRTGIGWNWNRIGLFDITAALLLTWAVIRFWVYAMAQI